MKKMLVLIFLLAAVLNAQVKLNGIIKDAKSGEILPGATVLIEKTLMGTKAGSNGYFEIKNIPAGTVTVKISYVGYKTLIKSLTLTSDYTLNAELTASDIFTKQVVVTASRSEQMIGDVPGRIAVISPKTIEQTPKSSVDDLLKSVSGVQVDRQSGMFTVSPTVNIRGISSTEQGRVLAMIDGQPVNKSDGGTVNWNRIIPSTIERIEIFKGPGSSIYGSNAMGGVINFITKKNELSGYHALLETSFGTLNTFSQSALLTGRIPELNGVSIMLNGYNRNSDGYNTYRETPIRDVYKTTSPMKETGIDARISYDISEKTSITANYNFYDDKRETGVKVNETNFQTQRNNYASFILNTEIAGMKMNASAFYQNENYIRHFEKYKLKSGSLSQLNGTPDLIYVDAARNDFGANANLTIPFSNLSVVTGIEYKRGSIDGTDSYQNTTDRVTNKGHMDFMAAFAQGNLHVTENLIVTAGLRFDYVRFSDGAFILTNPTSSTSFMSGYAGNLPATDWSALTPKVSLQYRFTENLKAYAAYSRGFRAGTLDDLTRCGLISLGFKNANPNLKPEYIDNFELGATFDVDKSFYFMPSIYYMHGSDFMYYIQTSLPPVNNKPVIIKDNITSVDFYGADIDVKYFMNRNFYVFVNYTYSKSQIASFKGNTALEGKELTYSPNQIANLGVTCLNKYVNTTVQVRYQSSQFINDDNSLSGTSSGYAYSAVIDPGFTVDLKLWQKFFNMVTVNVDVQNLLDYQMLTVWDRLSLGRMITAGISVEL